MMNWLGFIALDLVYKDTKYSQICYVVCSTLKAMHVDHIFVFVFLQNMDDIPEDIKNLYKTVWEISQKTVMKMAADRGAYIDQSQSLNIHIAEPNYGKLTSMHFYAWKLVSTFYSQVSRTHRYLYVYFVFPPKTFP